MENHTQPNAQILGDTLPSTRSRPRSRYSYPTSASEWTEYKSPIRKPELNFFIDSVGDQSMRADIIASIPIPTSPNSLEELDPNRIKDTPSHRSKNSPLCGEIRTSLTALPEIQLSPEQIHVLNLVKSGRRYAPFQLLVTL